MTFKSQVPKWPQVVVLILIALIKIKIFILDDYDYYEEEPRFNSDYDYYDFFDYDAHEERTR